jgi:hypothetical protein
MADQWEDRNVGRLDAIFYHGVVRPDYEVDCALVVLLIVALSSSAAGVMLPRSPPMGLTRPHCINIFFSLRVEDLQKRKTEGIVQCSHRK